MYISVFQVYSLALPDPKNLLSQELFKVVFVYYYNQISLLKTFQQVVSHCEKEQYFA